MSRPRLLLLVLVPAVLALGACEGDGTDLTIDVAGADTTGPSADVGVPSEDAGGGDASTPLPPAPAGPCTVEIRALDSETLQHVLTYVWEEADGTDRVDRIDVDAAGDGTIEDTFEWEYDAEGRLVRREGIGYPNSAYDSAVTWTEDGSSVVEMQFDRDGDGETDETWLQYWDADGRMLRLERGQVVTTYSEHDEFGNYQRSELVFRANEDDGGVLHTVCTYQWRGRGELVLAECRHQPDDTLTSRTTVTYEDGRAVRRTYEMGDPIDGSGFRELRRDTLTYDERGWLTRETWTVEGQPGTDLRYGYACWEE